MTEFARSPRRAARGIAFAGLAAGPVAVAMLLAGCGLIPPEGPSLIDQQPKIDSGPSAQRLGDDGFPLIGAFPKSAAPQLADPAVASDRGQLQAVAGAQAATATSGSAAYDASVSDAKAVQAATRREVDEAVSQARGSDGPLTGTGEDVLRTIEGR